MSKIPFIVFPKQLNINSMLDFKETLEAYSGYGVVGLDFSEARWATPFYLLMASTAINEFREKYGTKLRAIGFQGSTYFSHMGFFYSFGLPHGKRPGEANGGLHYLPITILESEEIKKEADSKGIAVGQCMEHHAERISKVLIRKDSGDLYDALTFSLREMLRNIVEHSESKRIAYSAQYYPNKGRVELAVSDWGCGLRKSLEQNPDIKLIDDKSALEVALMPGVSGKGAQVKKLRVKTEWTNSGYGLYMTSRLCRSVGTFLLGSGDSAISLSGELIGRHDWGFRGTAVCMDISINRLAHLQDSLDSYRKEASMYCQSHGKKNMLKPSIASTALRRNFAKGVKE